MNSIADNRGNSYEITEKNRQFPYHNNDALSRKKALLIFTDLDGTFTPASAMQLTEFCKKMKYIQDNENVQIKLSVVSGRNSGHVRAWMQNIDFNLIEEKVHNPTDISFPEQGAVVIFSDSQVESEFIGTKGTENLKQEVKIFFQKSIYSEIFEQCPSNQYNSAFVFKARVSQALTNEEQFLIKKSFIELLKDNFSDRMNITDSGAVEIAPHGVSKEKALEFAIKKYQKDFNISGIIYCGDSANDLSAIKYVSKLAITESIKCWVFTPSNSSNCISSENLEKWSLKLIPEVPRVIGKASLPFLAGINELFSEKINEKSLIGVGLDSVKVKDELDSTYKKSNWVQTLNKLRNPNKRENNSINKIL